MFHLIIITLILLGSIRWGNWRRWRDFLPSIYYVIVFNMYYKYIAHTQKELWFYKKPLMGSTFFTETLYTFVLLPCLVVMFLSYFPETKSKKLLYYLKYILISIVIEILATKTNHFGMKNGWNLYWEIFFYPIMYILIRTHFLNPRRALIISAFIIIFLFAAFKVNVI